MYAVIVTGGKQYRVEKGDVIFVEKLNAEAESEFSFDTVLAVGEEGNVKFGNPTVAGAQGHRQGRKERQGQEAEHPDLPPQEGSACARWATVSRIQKSKSPRSSVNRGGHLKWHIKKA